MAKIQVLRLHFPTSSSALLIDRATLPLREMPTFPAVPNFARSNLSPRSSKTDNCCSRTERCCWTFATWFPVAILYVATLWAVYVNVYLISLSFIKGIKGFLAPFFQPLSRYRSFTRLRWVGVIRFMYMVIHSCSLHRPRITY